jgi:hypothetical protein
VSATPLVFFRGIAKKTCQTGFPGTLGKYSVRSRKIIQALAKYSGGFPIIIGAFKKVIGTVQKIIEALPKYCGASKKYC